MAFKLSVVFDIFSSKKQLVSVRQLFRSRPKQFLVMRREWVVTLVLFCYQLCSAVVYKRTWSGLRSIPSDIDAHLTTEVNLANNKITVKATDFANFLNLETLKLGSNKMISIEPEAFRNMTSLEKINLAYNEFTEVPDLHYVADSLQEMYLHNNPIKTLRDFTFSAYVVLKKMDIQKCEITSVETYAFSGLSSLETLILTKNKLSILGETIFQGLISINSIKLDKNSLSNLPNLNLSTLSTLQASENKLQAPGDAFVGATGLRTIYLNKNGMKVWPDLYDAANLVKKLYLEWNEIMNVTQSQTEPYKKLTELFLKNNKLINMPCFPNSRNTLETIDASNNQIETVPLECFDNFTKVKSLDLRTNHLREIPNFDLQSLEILDLSHNELQNITKQNLAFLPALREIYLSNNNLTEFPDFEFCPKLEKLYASSNKLSGDISECLANTKRLTDLRINTNKLSEFPNFSLTWSENGTLQLVDLSENEISSIPNNHYSSLNELQSLNLGDNKLTQVPTILNVSAESLEKLNISHNDIESISTEELFRTAHLPSGNESLRVALKELYIQYNRIQSIPDDLMPNLQSLETLQAAQNVIKELPNLSGSALQTADFTKNQIQNIIPENLINMTALTHLYLQKNLISDKTFQIQSLTHLTALEELHLENNLFNAFGNITGFQHLFFNLYLTGNPLHCDKSLCWAKDLQYRPTIYVLVEEPSCVEPTLHTSRPWHELNVVNMGCGGGYFELENQDVRSNKFVANTNFLAPENLDENSILAMAQEDCALVCRTLSGTCKAFYFTEKTLQPNDKNCMFLDQFFIITEYNATLLGN